MCNGASKNATAIERDIFYEIAGPPPPSAQPETINLKPEEVQKYVALWRDEKTHFPVRSVVQNGVLRVPGGPLRSRGDGSFQVGPAKFTFTFAKDGKPISAERDIDGEVTHLIAEPEWKPTAEDLNAFAGTWHSDEADATFSIVIEDGKAFAMQRPASRLPLQPVYKDHFTAPGEIIWFTRDKNGLKLHVGASRTRDMPFERVETKK